MAVEYSRDLKYEILRQGFVRGGTNSKLYVQPTQNGTVISGTDITEIKFDVDLTTLKVSNFAIVRLSIPQGYTVNGLNFYNEPTGTGNYFKIELETIPGSPDEIGDYTQQQGTYQINVLDIIL